MLPEIQDLKIQVAKLEKDKEELRASLELTQADVEVLKEQASVTAATLKITTGNITKLESSSRGLRNNSASTVITRRNPQKIRKRS